MANSNSFEQTENGEPNLAGSSKRRSKKQCALIGFLLFASPAVLFGVYRLVENRIYNASLPPGEWICLMPAFFAFIMMFLIGPACGLVGLIIGMYIGHQNELKDSA